ncbi:MAG TPA: hypothetical protein VLF90_04710 [Patescibacteria group bacterium]|nr:hypothetical protein [Patescibacteria group bacterium]
MRNVLNRGYLEHIILVAEETKKEQDRQIALLEELNHLEVILGELATDSSIIPADAPDEWFLFRDQMYEFERGYRQLDIGSSDSETMSKNSSH